MSNDTTALLNYAIALVDSGLEILGEHLTSDDELSLPSALIPGGTLGKHFRHVAETYGAFLSAVDLGASHQHSLPQIDYNAQLPSSRDDVACVIESCQGAMRKVRDGLVALGDTDLDAVLQLPVEVIAITPTRQAMTSTIGREVSMPEGLLPLCV